MQGTAYCFQDEETISHFVSLVILSIQVRARFDGSKSTILSSSSSSLKILWQSSYSGFAVSKIRHNLSKYLSVENIGLHLSWFTIKGAIVLPSVNL